MGALLAVMLDDFSLASASPQGGFLVIVDASGINAGCDIAAPFGTCPLSTLPSSILHPSPERSSRLVFHSGHACLLSEEEWFYFLFLRL